jgi:uncharacterized protein (DUF1697 family)
MKAIAGFNPFIKKKNIDPRKLHVTFLSPEPGLSNVHALNGIHYPPDEFILKGKEIYLHCPDGYGRSKLNNNFFEKKLKVTATTRNWRTVNELIKLAESE